MCNGMCKDCNNGCGKHATFVELYQTKVFERELEKLFNKTGLDNILNTPDYTLTEYIIEFLDDLYTSQVDNEK